MDTVEQLNETERVYEEEGLKSAREIIKILDTYQSDDAIARVRLAAAVAGANQSTRRYAGRNNRLELLVMVLDRAGVSSHDALAVVREAGFLPASIRLDALSKTAARLLGPVIEAGPSQKRRNTKKR